MSALTLDTLEALGGAQQIVRTHLDSALRNFSQAERYTVADLFHQLVTPSGTKIAHSAGDLAEYVDLSQAQVTELLEKLAGADTRIVRAVAPPAGDSGPTRYEIFHDVLAPSILDWRSRQASSRRARMLFRRRVLRLLAVVGAAVIALIVWLAISAVNSRNQADAAAGRARSLETQAVVMAGQLRVRSRQQALLAAKYNRQRSVEASLKGQAERNATTAESNATRANKLAIDATNQEGRANQLAAVNKAQASRETVLAAAAQRNAGAARLNATAAEINLAVGLESNALSEIAPALDQGVTVPPAGVGVTFNRAVLTRVPPSASIAVWDRGIHSAHLGVFRTSVRGSNPQSTLIKSLTAFELLGTGHFDHPLESVTAEPFGARIYFLITLRDLGWLDVITTQRPSLVRAPQGKSYYTSDLRASIVLCRLSGSRARSSDVPAKCPTPAGPPWTPPPFQCEWVTSPAECNV